METILQMWAKWDSGHYIKFDRTTERELRLFAKRENITIEQAIMLIVDERLNEDLIEAANDAMNDSKGG